MEYPVRILSHGVFTEFLTILLPGPKLSATLKKRVKEVWAAELKRNPKLFSGPLLSARYCSLFSFNARTELEIPALEVGVWLTEYKNFMGTTADPDIDEDDRHYAFSALAVTVSADNHLIIGVRSHEIDYPGLYHAVPACRITPYQANPYVAIFDEYQSELGISEAPPYNIFSGIGLVEDLTWGRLTREVVILRHLDLQADEIIEAAARARSAHEHTSFICVDWNPTSIRNLLLENAHRFVPTGWAGINLAAAHSFGDNWQPIEWTPTPRTYDEHMALARNQ